MRILAILKKAQTIGSQKNHKVFGLLTSLFLLKSIVLFGAHFAGMVA